MKYLFLIIAVFYQTITYGQDTTYFNENWKEINSKSKASFTYVITKNKNYPDSAVERTYYKNGQIRYERFYYSFNTGAQYGKDKQWYSNGNLKAVLDYKGNEITGRQITYWENGLIKRNDSLLKDKLVEGKCFSSVGKDTSYFAYQTMPYLKLNPKSEYDDHQDYISKKLKYPPKSKANKVEGDVQITFTVEKNGTITNVVISQGINEELDNEALRVVKSMPKWTPGTIDGIPSKFHLTIPVTFEIKKN